jgi:3-hydroxymyristoyl/3-hydroxydecanoyl-(acyl carrier protein) dehydratase
MTAQHRTELCIPASHPSLPGHFPGNPVVPGVVLLDRVAAAIEASLGARIAALPQAKFLAPLLPQQVAQLELAQIAPARLRFRITRDGTPIASGEVELT